MTRAPGLEAVAPFEASDPLADLRPGDAVVCSQGLMEPAWLLEQLLRRGEHDGPYSLLVGPTFGDHFERAQPSGVRLASWCATGRNARQIAAGRMDLLPIHYREMAALLDARALACDVALLTLAWSEAEQKFYLGFNCDYTIDAARRARVVLAEVNDRLPLVRGAELPGDIQPRVVRRVSAEPPELPDPAAEATPQDQALAQHVAGLVPEGATLALGVGTLPALVLQALAGHRHLGIHSPVLVDALVDLVHAGAVDNSRKPIDTGVSVGGLLMGGRKLSEFAHANPLVRLAPPRYTHDLNVIGQLPDFVALTGAVEVDLTGQVNGEMAQGRYVGAVGGQLDLVRGARASAGGQSITMLHSTARQGTVSRIVARLGDAVVTTPRADVDRVVTEFGVAHLRGKSVTQRIEAMIAIAHPGFRAELQVQAREIAGAAARGHVR
jgi:acyl-CoA hydrolase